MAKCVLLFLFLIIGACSDGDKKASLQILTWSQKGEVSFAEFGGQKIRIDNLEADSIFDANHRFLRKNRDLWFFEFDGVSVWRIDGDIPDGYMYLQENSVAILGKNAVLAKVLALRFMQILVMPDFEAADLLILIQNYGKKVIMANEMHEIIFTTDGVSWYF